MTSYTNHSHDLDLDSKEANNIFSLFSACVTTDGGGGALRNYTTGVTPQSRGDKVHIVIVQGQTIDNMAW